MSGARRKQAMIVTVFKAAQEPEYRLDVSPDKDWKSDLIVSNLGHLEGYIYVRSRDKVIFADIIA